MAHRRWIIVLTLLLALIFALWGSPRLIESIPQPASYDDVDAVLEYLHSFWPWTLLIVLILMVLEALIAPMPVGPVIAANAALFGLWGGFFVSWFGALAGAAAGFWLARLLGLERVYRLVNPRYVERFDALIDNHAFSILLLARFVPGANAVISYLAGLSPAKFGTFIAASALGLIPWIFLFTFLSHNLLQARTYGTWLGIAAPIAILVYLIYRIRSRRTPR